MFLFIAVINSVTVMALDMAVKAVIAVAQKGFEQEDFHAVMRATARKNIITFIAAQLKTGAVGSQGEDILPNMKFDETVPDQYSGLVFIGGGAAVYRNSQAALKLAKEFYGQGRVVAASGDAVPVLAGAGLLEGKLVACDENLRPLVENVAVVSEENVVADGNIITAKSGFGNDFGEKLSEALKEAGTENLRRSSINL